MELFNHYYDTLSVLLDAIAMITIVALLCKPALSHFSLQVMPVALGFLMGGVAILQMSSPILIAPGIIVDLRNLPIALAAAFLGVRGLVPALLMATVTRIWLGGAGMQAGVLALFFAGAGGLLWAHLSRAAERRGFAWLSLLGVLASAHLFAAMLIPAGARQLFLIECAPVLVALNMIGAWIVGSLLEQHNAQLKNIQKLSESAHHDPQTGLLNKRGFTKQLAAYRAESRQPASIGALQIRLRHLGWVQKMYGTDARDMVLQTFGNCLLNNLRSGDLALRADQDRIAVLLPDISQATMIELTDQISKSLSQAPVPVADLEDLRVGVDMGMVWETRITDPLTTLNRALQQLDPSLAGARPSGAMVPNMSLSHVMDALMGDPKTS